MRLQYLKYINRYSNGNPSIIKLTIPKIILSIVKKIKLKGGESYLVGGSVIDILCGDKPKDWDIEVYNISYQKLTELLSSYGSPDLIGNKFGVVKLKLEDIDMEFSIPRRESRTGLKHQDFDIELIPELSVEEAAIRRDFTINAIYLDLTTGIIKDPFYGLYDLRFGKLQHISSKTFKDDPLRVFRGIQIIGRKVSESTTELNQLVSEMLYKCELKDVPREAIFQELNKLFLKANSFKSAAIYLEKTNLLEYFPELLALVDCPQKEEHHKEGCVWTHTKMVVEQAFKYRDELPEEWKLPFMWGMLLHDIGKPETLDLEKLSTYGHDLIGAKKAKNFMLRFTNSEDFIKKVCLIIRAHMRGRDLVKNNCKMKSWRKLQNVCRLDVLAYVSMCDSDGRLVKPEGKEGAFKGIMEKWHELGCPKGKIPSTLMGRHLIEHGLKPGPEFGAILEAAYNYEMKTGCKDIEQLYKNGIGIVKKKAKTK